MTATFCTVRLTTASLDIKIWVPSKLFFTMEALMLGLTISVALYPVSIAYACLEQNGMYVSLEGNKTL